MANLDDAYGNTYINYYKSDLRSLTINYLLLTFRVAGLTIAFYDVLAEKPTS